MAHTSQIKLGGRSYRIFDFKYVLKRDTKKAGSVSAESKCTIFEFTVISQTDLFFHDILIGDKKMEGEITLNLIENGKPSKTEIEFKEAHITYISEDFAFEKDSQVYTKIVMSGGEVIFKGETGGDWSFKNAAKLEKKGGSDK